MRKASVDEIFTITKGKGCWRSGRKEEKKSVGEKFTTAE